MPSYKSKTQQKGVKVFFTKMYYRSTNYSLLNWIKRNAIYDVFDNIFKIKIPKKKALNFDIIKYPIVTEKSELLTEKDSYTFAVISKVTKKKIKVILEILLNIQINGIQTAHIPPQKKRGWFKESQNTGLYVRLKKAIIRIPKGTKLSFY